MSLSCEHKNPTLFPLLSSVITITISSSFYNPITVLNNIFGSFYWYNINTIKISIFGHKYIGA